MIITIWFIKTTLVLIAALSISRVRSISAGLRHLLLLIALASLPLLWITEQHEVAPLIILEAPQIAVDLIADAAGSGGVAERGTAIGAAKVVVAAPSIAWSRLAMALYLGIAAVLLLRFVRRLWSAGRWVRSLPVIERSPLSIRDAREAVSPFAWGWQHPSIVVPSDWHRWSAAKRRSVLLHESAHLRRGDAVTATGTALVCILFWFHPLSWLTQRRIAMLAEQACDDIVIREGVANADYAEHLLEISTNQTAAPAPAMASPSTLGVRVRALLDDRTRRQPMTKPAALALTMSLCLAIASLTAVGTRAESAISDAVTADLTEIKAQIDDGRMEDARAGLNDLRGAELNANEQAQLANMSGYAYYLENDYSAAIAEYETVIRQPDQIPDGLHLTTLYTLAQLHYLIGQFPQAIEFMQRWQVEAEHPGPTPLVFLARAYYETGNYPAALESLQQGIGIAESRGSNISPNWLVFRTHVEALLAGEQTTPPQHMGLAGDYLPIVKVAPTYPREAKEKKIEGFVLVEFSVGTDGSTQDAHVIEAVPADIFDEAALQAVAKFRYRPRVEDGEPVVVTGVRNRITFALNES